MSSLTIKRLIVWIVSMVVGLALAYLIITLGFDALPLISSVQTGQSVTIEEYGILYFLFTGIPLGFVVLIWLDAFLDTRILTE